MSTKSSPKSKPETGRLYRGAELPMSAIRRYARDVAKRFHPDKIILFGSHAYGTPHADSDVDILVIMRCRDTIDQAVKIRLAFDPPFPLDVIVRTPHAMRWRLAEGDDFLLEIVSKGKVLYEAPDSGVGKEGGSRLSGGTRTRKRNTASS